MIGRWGFDLTTESFAILNLLLIVVFLFKVIITPKNDMMKS